MLFVYTAFLGLPPILARARSRDVILFSRALNSRWSTSATLVFEFDLDSRLISYFHPRSCCTLIPLTFTISY